MLISIYIYRFKLKCLSIKTSINILISEQKASIINLVKKCNIKLNSINEIITLLFILNMSFNKLII